MILTLDNEFEFNSDRKAVPICPWTSGVIVHVGYVGLLFCGSFWMHAIVSFETRKEQMYEPE